MKWLVKTWGRYFLWAEGILSLVIVGSFVYWSEQHGGSQLVTAVLKDNRGAVYGALTSVFGSLLGFTITAESIVLGLSGSERLSLIRDSKQWPILWATFIAAIRCLGLATAASLTGLIFDRNASPQVWVFYFVLLGSVLAVARLARCIWILEQVVAIVSGPTKERGAGE